MPDRPPKHYHPQALQGQFTNNLGWHLHATEWETVITNAARTRFPLAEVKHTGGPSERGADLEIRIPNLFGGANWVIVVQVKDYTGEIGPEVADQLRQAITTRGKVSDDGGIEEHVIAAVLACTNAVPSAALQEEIYSIEADLKVPVSIAQGEELMELILRGALQVGFGEG